MFTSRCVQALLFSNMLLEVPTILRSAFKDFTARDKNETNSDFNGQAGARKVSKSSSDFLVLDNGELKVSSMVI